MLLKQGDKTPTVVDSTASPYKFTKSVMEAVDPKHVDEDDFELVNELEKLSGVPLLRPYQNYYSTNLSTREYVLQIR